MSFTAAWTELIEKISEFLWTEPLYTKTTEGVEHVLMFEIPLKGTDGLSAAELFHIRCGTKYSAGAFPISVLPPLKIVFQRDFVTVEVNPVSDAISVRHIFFVPEDRLGGECIGRWRVRARVFCLDFL